MIYLSFCESFFGKNRKNLPTHFGMHLIAKYYNPIREYNYMVLQGMHSQRKTEIFSTILNEHFTMGNFVLLFLIWFAYIFN